MNLRIISAGAGSGKTYRLTSEMVDFLKSGKVQATGIIATTFTNKAAAELQERVRTRLLEEGLSEQADELSNALIGTVHSLGVKLLKRFAFEAGVSPEVNIIAEEDQQLLFNQSLSSVLTIEKVEAIEQLSDRLGFNKREQGYDWRKYLMHLTEVARANDFSRDVLGKSKQLSFESFQKYLKKAGKLTKPEFSQHLTDLLDETIKRLEDNEDFTKTTKDAVKVLKRFLQELTLRGELFWYQLAKIHKLKVGAKSKGDISTLKEYAIKHEELSAFHQDIQAFIYYIFEIAIEALDEYATYKKGRGLIDYTDMEVHIKRLLDDPQVSAALNEELELLMVDEFQDTSPMQLEIFLKLASLAKFSIWVGDPKQSIYGFRGADPRLMQAIIDNTGGIKTKDIQEFSWRSREDIVFATNAIFTKAFSQLPSEQIALKPKRKIDGKPLKVSNALIHWHFRPEGKRMPAKPWMENSIAFAVRKFIESRTYIFPKRGKAYRPVQAGDIAILCRSNKECEAMAEALHRAGLKAAIAQSGLLKTAEAKLILACLKFILHRSDTLSIAEILLLSGSMNIEDIIEDRMAYFEKADQAYKSKWATEEPIIEHINKLRPSVVDLSSAEILDLLLEELELRRIIVSWGNPTQRLDNVDVLRSLALKYEEACNRLHSAASLGGFLLWLSALEQKEVDQQSSGENAEAVNVLTYHKSKGLEWPVTICHSLENRLRAEVWGIDIVAETEEVDLNNVLDNRWIRYWINPYADQQKGTPLVERLNESEVKKEVQSRALQEEARLMYVGMTRARDYLIFPTRTRVATWLNRVCNGGDGNIPTLNPESNETPWQWKGRFLPIETTSYTIPEELPEAQLEENPLFYWEESQGKKRHLPKYIDLRKEPLRDIEAIVSEEPLSYPFPFHIKEDFDHYNLAKVCKILLAGDDIKLPKEERKNLTIGLLEHFEIPKPLHAALFLKLSEGWVEFLDKQFKPMAFYRKYPLQLEKNKQIFRTVADTILETENGFILIQNSGYYGELKQQRKKARELASWLQLSKEAIQLIFNHVKVKTFVHFVLSGVLIEVETQRV